MDKEKIKLDRNRISTRNFNIVDWIAFVTFPLSLVVLILFLFLAIWIDFGPILSNIILTIMLLLLVTLGYIRMMWYSTEVNSSGEKQYEEAYSTIIEDEEKD